MMNVDYYACYLRAIEGETLPVLKVIKKIIKLFKYTTKKSYRTYFTIKKFYRLIKNNNFTPSS